LKEEVKSNTDIANKVVNIRSATLSPLRCSSTIFGEIATIPSSYASNLVVASKIPVYLDVCDHLVLYKEE
jgi:hypothetical protein